MVANRARWPCPRRRPAFRGLTTSRSAQAILDAENLCEQHLGGRFKLDAIDIYQRPALARDEQIVAVPTLVRRLPEPLRKLVGDLSNAERVLIGLDLLERDQPRR